MRKKIRFIFLFLIAPLSSMASNPDRQTESIKNLFGYKVTVGRDLNGDRGFFEIFDSAGELVYAEADIGDSFFVGNQFSSSDNPSQKRTVLAKFDSKPYLLISKWTGGAHCCNWLYVFQLKPKLKLIETIAGGSSNIDLIDFNKDGNLEVFLYDGVIDYVFASFASSPAAPIVLEFKNDRFQVNRELTHLKNSHLPRSSQQIESFKSEIAGQIDLPELPFGFLEAMIHLSYSGRLSQALELADQTWPASKSGLNDFKKEFKSCLADSDYWIFL